MEVRSGDRVSGDLTGADTDALVFMATRATTLSLQLKSENELITALTLVGPGGAIDVEMLAAGAGSTRRKLNRLPLPESGAWVLRIRSAAGSGRYDLRLRIDTPKTQRVSVESDAAGDSTWVFDTLPSDARLRVDLKTRGSIAPDLRAVAREDGELVAIEGLRESARSARFELAPEAQSRRIGIFVASAPRETIEVRTRLKLPRAERRDVSLLGDPAPPAQARPRTHPNLGFESWLQIDRIPVLEPGRRTAMFSSFDRSGGNDDGFSGAGTSWLNYRLDPTSASGFEVILFDVVGAGILNRMHFAFLSSGPPPFFDPEADRYDLRFYFDGDTTPTFVVPLRDFVAGASPNWPYPLAADEFAAVGGPYNNTPIPFREGLRISATGVPHFFDFQYELWDDPATLRSYALSDDPGAVLSIVQASGTDPKVPEESSFARVIALLPKPGESYVLHESTSAGSIIRIDFALDTTEPLSLEEYWLEATFDEATSPQASAPIGAWVASSPGFCEVNALFFHLGLDGRGSIYWPMPFARSVRLVLHHRGSNPRGRVMLSIEQDPRPPEAGFAHLHVVHRDQLSAANRDVLMFEHVGRGKIVGVGLTGMTNLPGLTRGYLEGDERVFIDGSRSPALHGTGTEEFFGWGWYEAPIERRFSLPQHGSPYRIYDGVQDITTQYRVLFPDEIHFERSIAFQMECGPKNLVETAGIRYVSTVFAYLNTTPGLVLTDNFDPASPPDRLAHAYGAQGVQQSVELSSGYEGDEVANAPLTDRGNELRSGFIEFELTLDRDNRGALLRRRVDQMDRAGQSARVFLDGQFAGVWRTALNNAEWRWLDTDFELAARFTQGKSRVRIRIEPLIYPWNEFHYQLWSRLP